MTTKTTTESENNMIYNPTAQGVYNNLVSKGGKVLGDYVDNPLGNAMYRMGLGQSQAGATAQGANNQKALQQNMLTSGLTGQAGAGFNAAQTAKMGRANASMMSNANVSNVMQAFQRQMQATGMGMSFSPQLSGTKGTETTQKSGLGTWLPQVIGAGVGAVTGGLGGGGLSGILGGMTGQGGGGASAGGGNSAFSGMPNIFAGSGNNTQNPYYSMFQNM